MATRTLVIGDLHLRGNGNREAATTMARLLESFPDVPVVFAGDTIDIAADPHERPQDAVAALLAPHRPLCRALAERAARGVRCTFVTGNHDAALGLPQMQKTLHASLGLRAEDAANVSVSPWFVRLAAGRVHVEHGHVFDPDGAPTHPLADAVRPDVGIAVLRGFIVPLQAHELALRHHEPPLALLLRVIALFGPRAPSVILAYIRTAASTFRRSGSRFPLQQDRQAATQRLQAFAASVQMDAETLGLLLEAHATPVLARATHTFLRLYLDRIASVSALVGATATTALLATVGAPASYTEASVSVAALAALWTVGSVVASNARFRGRPQRALALGAERTAEITGARHVLLGHVHQEDAGPRYCNTGSFAYPRSTQRRPYLWVSEDGDVERAYA